MRALLLLLLLLRVRVRTDRDGGAPEVRAWPRHGNRRVRSGLALHDGAVDVELDRVAAGPAYRRRHHGEADRRNVAAREEGVADLRGALEFAQRRRRERASERIVLPPLPFGARGVDELLKMLVVEPVEHAALAEQPAEIGERDFLRAGARERIAVRHDLLARAGHLIAERARELLVRRLGQVAFENAGGAQQHVGEGRRQAVRVRAQARDLRLQSGVGERGLRRVGCEQRQALMNLIEVRDDRVDRAPRCIALDQHVEGLECRLDRGAGRAVLLAQQRRRSGCGASRAGPALLPGGRLGAGAFARQCGLVADRFEQLLDRRGCGGGGAERDVFRLVGGEPVHLQLAERVAPRRDEVAGVELEQRRTQRIVLRLHGGLLAGGPKHPAFLLHLFGDVAEPFDEAALEARIGEEAGHPYAFEVLVADRAEHQREVLAAVARRRPSPAARRSAPATSAARRRAARR